MLFLIIPIFNFFLQSYPRFFNKLFGVDVWTRLLEIDHVRKNKHRIPNKKLSGQFLVEGYFDYPPLFPYVLSFIPKKTLLQIQGFIAPAIDSLQVILVYFVAYYLTGNEWLALTAQVFYMATPMIAIENSYLTPRSLGYLNFSLATISLLFFMYTNQYSWLLAGIFFTTTLFIVHRFAVQSFVLITLFFTFYLNTPMFIQVLLIGFVLALIITKGYYLRVLKGHFYNIYFWVTNLDYRFAHQIRGIPKKNAKTDFVGKIYILLSAFSPIAIFGLNSWALSAFALFGLSYFQMISAPPIFYTMSAWIIFFYIFGVIVLKIKYLMPIGEGQRYMEMVTVPSSILSAYIVFSFLNSPFRMFVIVIAIAMVVVNLAVIIFIQIKGVIKDRNRSVTSNLFEVFTYINKMKNPPRILCIPHQNTTMTMYHTKAQVFVNADNPGLMEVTDVFPVMKYPVSEIAKKYNLTHALIKEGFITLKELGISKNNIVCKSGDVYFVSL